MVKSLKTSKGVKVVGISKGVEVVGMGHSKFEEAEAQCQCG